MLAQPGGRRGGMGHGEGLCTGTRTWWMVGVLSHSWVGCAFVPSPLPKRGLGYPGCPAAGPRGCFRIGCSHPAPWGYWHCHAPMPPVPHRHGDIPGAGTLRSRAKVSQALAPVPSGTLAHGGSWEQQLHPRVAPTAEEGTRGRCDSEGRPPAQPSPTQPRRGCCFPQATFLQVTPGTMWQRPHQP